VAERDLKLDVMGEINGIKVASAPISRNLEYR
jgi:hypothetical protein